MIKKLVLTLISLTMGSLAYAGTMGSVCKVGPVTIPCPAQQWDVNVAALYLKPLYTNASTLPSITGGFREVDPDWSWGYRLEGNYHFNMGNELTLNWLHYDHTSNIGTFAGAYLQLLPAVGAITIGAPFTSALTNQLDQANLVLGQHVDYSLHQSSRFYAGIQYANIELNSLNFFQIPAIFVAGTSGVRSQNNSSFEGVGPSVGMDYSYNIIPGLALKANTSGAVLIGTSRLDNSTIYGNGLIASSIVNSQKRVVTEFEAKLAANYAHPLAQGTLSLEGGYQVLNYLNALQTVLPTTTIADNDFGLYGPYLEVKWLGNV